MVPTRLGLIGLGLAIVLAGCSDAQRDSGPAAANAGAKATAALPTPMDQGTSDADVQITTTIRQSLVGKDGLSIEAANAAIITNGGVVVLRGKVRDANERAFIRAAAEATPGVTRVVDLLEISATH